VADGRLDEWFGRRVAVELAQLGGKESRRLGATLESADERGIVVSYQGRHTPNLQHSFFPWQNVRFVHLATETEESPTQGEQREMGPGLSVVGPEMSEMGPGMSGSWEDMFTSWLRDKQAGPLRCPVCGQGGFTPGATMGVTLVDDVTRPTAQFGYTSCDHCGYAMFFNADVSGLKY
jgi:predicted nucleic-acid-binding Zn-ribbon protein